MSKKNGIITLLVMLAVLVGGIYASIYGIDSNGSGSAANIKQGLDLAGGEARVCEHSLRLSDGELE